jgi:hypothetical protein
MKLRSAARIILLAIALGSPAVWGFRQWERWQAAPAGTSQMEDDIPIIEGDQVVMTYFTSNVRCRSCREIERLTQETATVDFPGEIANERLIFRVLNTDEPPNTGFISRYQITAKTVVISHRRNGKEVSWKEMADVWDLLDQPANFRAYLGNEVRRILQP